MSNPTVQRKRSNIRPTDCLLGASLLALLLSGAAAAQSGADWPLYSHDYDNSNYNDQEDSITAANARYLRRKWETFNDDAFVSEPTPTGFVLEQVLGLVFPGPVAGVVASPIVSDGTIYIVDELGTVFARDSRTGEVLDAVDHWTTTLSDPDFYNGDPPFAPELFYTAPVVRGDHVWVVGSFYGQAHLLSREHGLEHDFDPLVPGIQPFQLVPDRPVSSVLGDPIVVDTVDDTLLVVSVNVIVNDALLQEGETGLYIAYDVSDPSLPIEVWRRRTIDIDPSTGFPYGTGVSAVSGLAVDFQRGYLFGGTSQNTSAPYPEYPDPALAPPGYVDRGDALFAMDIETGEFLWTNQFHSGDVFDLNDPVSTGPNNPDGPRDADVLSPPVLFTSRVKGKLRDLVGDGSKGGLYRVVDRDTGETVWERQVSEPTGIGGIQASAAVANDVLYVAGFEGLDDGFSDAQFGDSLATGIYPNAFFATFSPAFWADVEDTGLDGNPATGMRVKVYALDAATGRSRWHLPGNVDYVSLPAGASLRHVSVTDELVFVATSSGKWFVLSAFDGSVLFTDQTPDLDAVFGLGLGKSHHASMNGGTVIANGMAYVPYGAQNNPSGGVMAYEINGAPVAADDSVLVPAGESIVIDALANDSDPNGDVLRFVEVEDTQIDVEDGVPDVVTLPFGNILVVNPGDDPAHPKESRLEFSPSSRFHGMRKVHYVIEDQAPPRKINGLERTEQNPTHTPRRADAWVDLLASGQAGT